MNRVVNLAFRRSFRTFDQAADPVPWSRCQILHPRTERSLCPCFVADLLQLGIEEMKSTEASHSLARCLARGRCPWGLLRMIFVKRKNDGSSHKEGAAQNAGNVNGRRSLGMTSRSLWSTVDCPMGLARFRILGPTWIKTTLETKSRGLGATVRPSVNDNPGLGDPKDQGYVIAGPLLVPSSQLPEG